MEILKSDLEDMHFFLMNCKEVISFFTNKLME